MHERIYNDFVLAEHRLQRVLIRWKLIQPRFAAKKTASLSPATRSLLILSLKQQHQRVTQSWQKVYELKACWDAYKKLALCCHVEFFKKARVNVADSIEPQGKKVQNEIEILLLEFRNPFTTRAPFNDLPYEFQKRLIQLLPPIDVTTFKSSGNTAFKAVRKHRSNVNFVNSLSVLQFIDTVKEISKSKKNSHKMVDKIAMTEVNFLNFKMAPIYVANNLSIDLDTEEGYSKVMNVISADFERIEIEGLNISWKQAFNLIYKSQRVKNVFYDFGKIQRNEFAAFFDGLIVLLKNRDIELLIITHCQFFPFIREFKDFFNNLDSHLGYFVQLNGNGNKITVSKFLISWSFSMSYYFTRTLWLI